MDQLQIFKNEEFGEVRSFIKENTPWFVAKDVCDVLGLTNPTESLKALDDDEKSTLRISEGGPAANIINESGLYTLVLRSNKPQAKKFKKWVTAEVLPAIRKHGAYMTENTIEKALASPDFLIQLATKLKEEQELNRKQQQIIGELKPKADYMDKILKNSGLVTITQIAKDYGMSGQAMNELLHQLGVQYKQSGQWLLYKPHQAKGYTHSQTVDITRKNGRADVKMNTKWTQKGRLFLYDLLKQESILPSIEQVKEAM